MLEYIHINACLHPPNKSLSFVRMNFQQTIGNPYAVAGFLLPVNFYIPD